MDWDKFIKDPPQDREKIAFHLGQAVAQSEKLMKELSQLEQQKRQIEAKINHNNGVIMGIKMACQIMEDGIATEEQDQKNTIQDTKNKL